MLSENTNFSFSEPTCCADNRSNSGGEKNVFGGTCTKQSEKSDLLKSKEKSFFCEDMILADYCCFFFTSPYSLSSSRDMNGIPYTEHPTKCKNIFLLFNNPIPPTIWLFNTKEEKMYMCIFFLLSFSEWCLNVFHYPFLTCVDLYSLTSS